MRVRADDQLSLEQDLRWVAGRLLRNAYRQAGDHDEQDHPTLARVVKAITGKEQWRSRPTLSLIEVVSDTINDLPEAMSGRSYRRATGTNWWASAPERHLARLLYGYLDDELEPRYLDGVPAPMTYDKDYVPAAVGLLGRRQRDSSVGRIFKVIREDLATALLRGERAAADRQARLAQEAGDSQRQPALIDRATYIEAIRSSIDAGKRLVCLWGEPGTGKTTLAGQAATALAPSDLVMNLRAGDPGVLRDDIVEALIAVGLEPTDWSDPYCRAMLRRALADQPSGAVVVIDNIDDETLIGQLVPRQPQMPVLLTMRTRPQGRDIAAIELDDFSEAEACSFIRSHLATVQEVEVLALARVLGYRPLALDHAVRFLQQSATVTVPQLVATLRTSVTEGLDLVADPADKARNLVRLYKVILAAVVDSEPARQLLDTFLALAGRSGMADRNALSAFMQRDAGGAIDPVRFASGLRALALYGLLREACDPWDRNRTLLVMHPLTYEIVRDLRTPVPFQIERAYLQFLQSEAVGDPEDDEDGPFAVGSEAWLRQQIFEVASQLDLPAGWKTLQVIDELTWVVIQEETADSDGANLGANEHLVRYELHPDATYKLDYRTGRRAVLEGEEAYVLARLARAYDTRVKAFLEETRAQYALPDDPSASTSGSCSSSTT